MYILLDLEVEGVQVVLVSEHGGHPGPVGIGVVECTDF